MIRHAVLERNLEISLVMAIIHRNPSSELFVGQACTFHVGVNNAVENNFLLIRNQQKNLTNIIFEFSCIIEVFRFSIELIHGYS